MSVAKTILIWLIVTKKWCAHQYRLFRTLFALSTLSKILKNKKRYLEIIVIHQCTKNHNYIIFNLQTMMWIALQVILGHFCLLPNFWPRKSNFLKKRKKARGYIIILLLHSKNCNHLMYSSLKMMPTALQVILGQF